MRLDKDGLPFALNGRALRVARGSGTSVKEVEELLTQARAMRGIAKMAGGMANASKQDTWYASPIRFECTFLINVCTCSRAKAAQQMQANGQRPNMQQVQAMQKAMPPDLLRQMRTAGSPQNAEKVMKDYMAKHGEEGINMNAMMQAMMGGGGMPNIPGMPGMSTQRNCDFDVT
jgi:signal recognition particle subunit SRP54